MERVSDAACVDEMIELGPHSTLKSVIQEGLGAFPSLKAIKYSHVLKRKESTN